MIENENLRVGDAERAHAVQQLQSQAAAGRLTPTELAERSGQAQSATRVGELQALFQDLPGGLSPLPQHTWDSLPQAPSGISDTAYPHQELVTPAAAPIPAPASSAPDGPAWADRRAERRAARAEEHEARRWSPWGFLIPVVWVAAMLLGSQGYGGAMIWVLPVILTMILGPLIAWDGRRRRDRDGH